MKRVALTGSLALALAASAWGCSSLRGGANPEQPLWIVRPSGSITVNYTRSLVAASRVEGEPYERGQPEIDAPNMRVFVGSSDHGLYAIRANDGRVLWRFETLGFVQCAPLYDANEDVVYFGSNDGALYKVRASDGLLLWRFMSNAEVARRPVLSNGFLYAANANDTLLALEAKTGALRWHQHRAPAAGMEVAGYSGPTLWRDKVYLGFSDGTVSAFDARTGAERWPTVDLSAEAEETLGQLPEQLDVDTTPVADSIEAGPVMFVGSYAGGVFALDAESGTQVWSNPGVVGVTELTLWSQPEHTIGGKTTPARRLLIASSGTTGLWGLDPENGRELWRRHLPSSGVSAPVPIAGALLVSASRLGVFLISPLGGELIDGIHLADGSSVTPAAYGTRAFVLTNGGSLLSLQVTSPI